MEILLEATNGTVRAVLKNTSNGAIAFLRSNDLQPSKIVMIDSSGKALEPFDERTRMKFDRTVRAAMFTTIEPGATLELAKERFRKLENGQFELRWGPYHYRQIAPGEWKVRVVFESKISAPTNGNSIKNAWTGKAESPEVRIDLR